MEKENKILIFRTSITQRRDIKRIGELLAEFPQIDKWNVDFEDWEKILRIECRDISALEISEVLRNNHIFATEPGKENLSNSQQLFQFSHSFRSSLLNYMYRTGSMRIYRFRINQIHLCSSRYIMKQPRRRIYVKRRTDNDENIRFLHILDGCFNFRHSFSKPYNERS